MHVLLHFPEEGVGKVRVFAGKKEGPPVPAAGTVILDLQPDHRITLEVKADCQDLTFLKNIGHPLAGLRLFGDAFPSEQLGLVGEHPEIDEIHLVGPRIPADEALATLSQLRNLVGLVLLNTSLGDDVLLKLPHRGLLGMMINYPSPGTTVGDASLTYLADRNPGLIDVHYCGTTISDAAFEYLGRLRSLRTLWLMFSPGLNGTGLKHLAGLDTVQYVRLDGTSVSDDTIASLADLPSLYRLGLNNTAITDRSLPLLLGMTSLRGCWVDGTQMSKEAKEALAAELSERAQRGPPLEELIGESVGPS